MYCKLRPFSIRKSQLGFVSMSSACGKHSGISSGSHAQAVETAIDTLFSAAKLETTTTKAGWCLREGMIHVAGADGGVAMLSLMQRHGIPSYFSCCSGNQKSCRHDAMQEAGVRTPSNCFESLCRTVVGQFVSGFSAMAAWKKILAITDNDLTPGVICALARDDAEGNLQKPVGLTKAKAACLVDLALHFTNGSLSEDFLTQADEATIRKALLKVRGIGPWSCDMFLLFHLERPNIMPLGDLGVRKGLAKHLGIDASKKEAALQRLDIYAPYQSLVTHYMWRVLDLQDPQSTTSKKRKLKTEPMVPQAMPLVKRLDTEPAESLSTPVAIQRRCRRRVTP